MRNKDINNNHILFSFEGPSYRTVNLSCSDIKLTPASLLCLGKQLVEIILIHERNKLQFTSILNKDMEYEIDVSAHQQY